MTQKTKALTSDDLRGMGDLLTRGDWLRILRSAVEKAQGQPIPCQVLGTLIASLIQDGGEVQQVRDELSKELTTATPRELAELVKRLIEIRGTV